MFRNKKWTIPLVLSLVVVMLLATTLTTLASGGTETVHVVKRGENLTVIGAIYGVDPYVLCHHNNISNCNLIYVGQRLIIPTSGARYGTSTSTTEETHWQRLERLDPVFRNQGWQAWLKEAGMTWNSISADARQIEEETSPTGRILASGLQVNAGNLWVPWPNIVTTDVPTRITVTSQTRKHQPDLRNASVLYTNVYANGPVTVWVDGSNWGQLRPTTTAPTLQCPKTPADLEAWGTVLQWLRDGSGQVAGAQLDNLNATKIQQLKACGCVVQGDNPSVRSVWLW